MKVRLATFKPEIGNSNHIEASKELVKLSRTKTVADRIKIIKQILHKTK